MFRTIAVGVLAFTASAFAADEVVEVSLGAPTQPYPQISAAVSAAESKRKGSEADYLGQLSATYNQVLAQASGELTKILGGRATSFLGGSSANYVIDVELVPSSSDEGAGAAGITAMEAKRDAAETALLQQATSELNELARVILAEYKSAAGAKFSFLQAPRTTNVKLTSDPEFPTILSLASDLEARRDVAEDAVRAKILEYQIKLAKSLNGVARAALR